MASSWLSGNELIAIVVAYALGTFPTGYLLVRLRTGQDLRQLGSGSTGARNVGRLLGRSGFALTLAGDLLKGALAFWIVGLLIEPNSWAIVAAIPAAVVGHIFPIQLGLHGGKGLATALGTIFVFDFRVALLLLIATALLGFLSKQWTLSVMIIALIVPVVALLFGHSIGAILGITVIVLAILLAHRTNILAAVSKMRGHAG